MFSERYWTQRTVKMSKEFVPTRCSRCVSARPCLLADLVLCFVEKKKEKKTTRQKTCAPNDLYSKGREFFARVRTRFRKNTMRGMGEGGNRTGLSTGERIYGGRYITARNYRRVYGTRVGRNVPGFGYRRVERYGVQVKTAKGMVGWGWKTKRNEPRVKE